MKMGRTMAKQISPEQFKRILPKICDRETSADPKNWTPENPLWGHCAVVSLLAQDLFDGQLLRASLEGTEFAESRSHYWNLLPSGKQRDFTRAQFGRRYPKGLSYTTRTWEEVLSYPPTVRRYDLLVERFQKAVGRYV